MTKFTFDSATGNSTTLAMLTSVKDMMDRQPGRLYHISIFLYFSYSVFRVQAKLIYITKTINSVSLFQPQKAGLETDIEGFLSFLVWMLQ